MHASGLDIFVLVSGSFSIVATIPLVYLALGSFRDGRELRRLQVEVAELMGEVRELQHEIHVDQKDARTELVQTKETVERVARTTRVIVVVSGMTCSTVRTAGLGRSVAERMVLVLRRQAMTGRGSIARSSFVGPTPGTAPSSPRSRGRRDAISASVVLWKTTYAGCASAVARS